MSGGLTRRAAIGALGGGGLTAAALAQTPRRASDGRFLHGVASGDPASDGMILWTRATPDRPGADGVALEWQVETADGAKVVQRGSAMATAARDYCAKVDVRGLEPGRDYRYQFRTVSGRRSPLGRCRTLPVGATADFVLALASCQLYPGGFFHAFADMARQPRLDLVLHLGDYIYEYGPDGYGAEIGRKIGRLPDPPHETVTLADYRRRHAQVKSDPDLQAAHARAAFVVVWDDHEVTNDGWIGGAENHQPAREGDWTTRKANALQAYFEWMPIRDPLSGSDPAAIYRSFDIGDLATLIMLETRLFARDEQVAFKGETPSADSVAALLAKRAEPGRELLGAAQSAWLEQQLRTSRQANRPWQLIGNQTVMARVAGPDLAKGYGPDLYPQRMARLPAAYRQRIEQAIAGYRAGVPFNMDAWDGYPAARERFYAMVKATGANAILFAGDSHAGWANDLHDHSGRHIACEFGTTAISSPSYGSILPGLGAILADQNPDVRWCDQDAKGYTLVRIDRDRVTADFIGVGDVRRPATGARRLARWTTRRTDGGITPLSSG